MAKNQFSFNEPTETTPHPVGRRRPPQADGIVTGIVYGVRTAAACLWLITAILCAITAARILAGGSPHDQIDILRHAVWIVPIGIIARSCEGIAKMLRS